MPNAFTEKNMFFPPILIFNTCFIEQKVINAHSDYSIFIAFTLDIVFYASFFKISVKKSVKKIGFTATLKDRILGYVGAYPKGT